MGGSSRNFPRRESEFAATDAGFRVILKRNCSISPRGLLLAYGMLAALSAGIAAGFALFGAWMILPFAGLELALLAGAFWLTARHAGDGERIELSGGRLRIEVREAERVRHYELDARVARVRWEEGHVMLRAPQAELEVGRHLEAEARAGFAAELGRRLQV
ncbi:MAG: DUF2244 domain-containing protein [Burkholderiales bacterium]